MQIKTTVRYLYLPVRMPKIKKTNYIKYWQGCGETLAGTLLLGMQMVQLLSKIVCQSLPKLNIHLPYDPAFPPRYLPKEIKAYVHTKTCTQMCIAGLFVMAQNWTQYQSASLCEWINKLWYIHTIEYYAAIKRYDCWHMLQYAWISK